AQRETAHLVRDGIDANRAGEAAAAQFLDAFDQLKDKVISLYWPIGSEIDTRPLLNQLHGLSAICALPVIVGKGRPLIFKKWQPRMALVPGPFHVPVPPEDTEVVIPELIVTPLLAFDGAGYRLGYGGGFYDRTLLMLRENGRCQAVGLAFTTQEIDAVVTDFYDERLDALVTEKDVRMFA
ncbi:MAG: 5-formyltetrahydrofolate cyclo-ligase, partial [Sneathiella sp.]